jgi:hypothetical protein
LSETPHLVAEHDRFCVLKPGLVAEGDGHETKGRKDGNTQP